MSVAQVAEITLETVNAKLTDTPRGTAAGCDARFAPITHKWGFKMYVSLIEAYYTFFRQRILHFHGLAPQVGQQMQPIEIPYGEGCGSTRMSYGYIVERVRIANDYLPSGWDMDDVWCKEDELNERMEELTGSRDGDLHPKNVGFDDNDNLLIVDCGQGTTTHGEHHLSDLRDQLIELELWQGDDVEYAIWGDDFATSDGRRNWDKCDCLDCIAERKRIEKSEGDSWAEISGSCHCSVCHPSEHNHHAT